MDNSLKIFCREKPEVRPWQQAKGDRYNKQTKNKNRGTRPRFFHL